LTINRSIAQRAASSLEAADRSLHEAYSALEAVSDVELASTLRKRLSALMALTWTGVLKQLYFEHPELCPAELRESLRPTVADWPIELAK